MKTVIGEESGTAVASTTCKPFMVKKGQRARVLRSYFSNGEGWHTLRAEDGTVFESPDIFWSEPKEVA